MTTQSESSIVFFRAAGHSHDGVNSSMIDTSRYSIFDFSLDVKSSFGDKNVQSKRALNKVVFDTYIASFVDAKLVEDIDLDSRNIYNPNINAGTIGIIRFDYINTWTAADSSSLTVDRELLFLSDGCVQIQSAYIILENRISGNVLLYAKLPTGSGTTLVSTTAGQVVKLASKRELKANIQSISNSIDKLKLLNPVSFQWKESTDKEVDLLKNSSVKYGFIAEEIEQIDPGLALYEYCGNSDNLKDDPNSYTPSFYDIYGLVGVLTSALKEAVERIEYLESQISR